MERKIKTLLNITDKQEEKILKWMDNYLRFPDPNRDILKGVEDALKEKPWETEEEKLYMIYMFGFAKGSDRVMELMNHIGMFDNMHADPKEKINVIGRINKMMDNAIGKKEE